MIFRVLIALLFVSSFHSPALSDENVAQKLMGGSLEDFGALNGIWTVNLKCNLLSTEKRKAFEFHRDHINEFVYSHFEIKDYAPAKHAAEQFAKGKGFTKCGAEEKSLVEESAERAIALSENLPEKILFDEEEYIKYLALRAKRLMGAVLVERKCKIMSEDTRSKMEGMLHSSVKALEEKLTKQRLGILYSIAKFEAEKSEAWNCGEAAKSLLVTRLTDLRDFYLTHKLESSGSN